MQRHTSRELNRQPYSSAGSLGHVAQGRMDTPAAAATDATAAGVAAVAWILAMAVSAVSMERAGLPTAQAPTFVSDVAAAASLLYPAQP